jgi:hypothetical protein
MTDDHKLALTWLTGERNLVRGVDEATGERVPEMTEDEMYASLVAAFPDIEARMNFAVEQMRAAA